MPDWMQTASELQPGQLGRRGGARGAHRVARLGHDRRPRRAAGGVPGREHVLRGAGVPDLPALGLAWRAHHHGRGVRAMTETKIDDLLSEAAAAGDVPGAAAAVLDRDGVIYEGVGGRVRVDGDAEVTSNTIFWLASMTKALVAVGVLQLVERGQLDLDAEVASIVPEFGELQVLEGYDGDEPRLRPPASRGDRAPAAHPHLGRRVHVPRRRRGALARAHGRRRAPRVLARLPPRAAGRRSRNPVGLRRRLRLGRARARGGHGHDPRLLPGRERLRPAGDGRHHVPAARRPARAADADPPPDGRRRAGRRRRARAPAPATDELRRPRRPTAPSATTRASCACCSAAASSTASGSCGAETVELACPRSSARSSCRRRCRRPTTSSPTTSSRCRSSRASASAST